MAQTSQLAVAYAALILHDDGVDITADKISALLKASGVSVEPFWPPLFAKLCEKRDLGDIIANIGSGVAAAPAAAAPAAPTEAKEEAKEEEEEEEEEADMGFSLFD